MTSVTDNVIKKIVDERCVSFCACNRAWTHRCSSQSGSNVMVPGGRSKEELQEEDIDLKNLSPNNVILTSLSYIQASKSLVYSLLRQRSLLP